MASNRFIVELKAPLRPDTIPLYYNKIKQAISLTKCVSIASKPCGNVIAGFDLSYNLASFLLEQNPQLEILIHLTCFDLNKVNITSRLIALQTLGIKRLLIISGDGYTRSSDPRTCSLQYKNSSELIADILKNFKWFNFIAVGGYPGGNGESSFNNDQECDRLASVLDLGAKEVLTQCVFDLNTFNEFITTIKSRYPNVNIIPSVAMFRDSTDLERISRLTRVGDSRLKELKQQLEQMTLQECHCYSFKHLKWLCSELMFSSNSIDLCTFGQFDMTEELVKVYNSTVIDRSIE